MQTWSSLQLVRKKCVLLHTRDPFVHPPEITLALPDPEFPRPGFIFIVERGALHILGSGATAANVSLQARLLSFSVLG